MPIVGPASAARNLRAETVAGRAVPRSPNPPVPPIRPGSLAELPPFAESGPERPRIAVPILPGQTTRPAEQETARTVIRAYQATREAMLAPPPAAEADAAPSQQVPAHAVSREHELMGRRRPAIPEEAGEQRPATSAVAGMVAAGPGGAVRQLVSLPAQAPNSDKSAISAKAAHTIDPPLREGGWTEAVTLLTIVAAVCLGVWMLF